MLGALSSCWMTTTIRAFRALFIAGDNSVNEVDRDVLVKIRTAYLSTLGNNSGSSMGSATWLSGGESAAILNLDIKR